MFVGLRNKSKCAGQSGSSLVEAAIVFPVFLLLLFGFIQYALIFANEITLRNAVAVGARSVSIMGAIPFGATPSLSPIEAVVRSAAGSLNQGDLDVEPSFSPGASAGTGSISISATYNMPLFFSWVVPGDVDGVMDLSAVAVVPEPR